MSYLLYEQLLRDHHLSNTRTRREVFQSLLKNHAPISMGELIKNCPDSDRVSVYRCIEVFEKIGVVHRIQNGWKYKLELGDVFKPHHHHMTCIVCGTSIEIKEPKSLHDEIHSLSKNYSFKPTRHSFEIEGYCQNCQP